MRWAQTKPYEWRPWLAWYPVSAGGQWVWLEWVERKAFYPHEVGECRDYVYRLAPSGTPDSG
jgi:hypothetical protein